MRNPRAHHRLHNVLLPAPLLSKINPVHALQTYFSKIHSILSSQLHVGLTGSSGFVHQNPVCISPVPHTCHMPRPSLLLDVRTRKVLCEEYKTWTFSLRSFIKFPAAYCESFFPHSWDRLDDGYKAVAETRM